MGVGISYPMDDRSGYLLFKRVTLLDVDFVFADLTAEEKYKLWLRERYTDCQCHLLRLLTNDCAQVQVTVLWLGNIELVNVLCYASTLILSHQNEPVWEKKA